MKRNVCIRSFSLFASVVLVFTAILSGPAFADKHGGGALNLTPFTRVALFNVVDDPRDADALAKEVATAIATYVATVDDTQLPNEFPANWILGGLEVDPNTVPPEVLEQAIEEAILRVPTPFRIDPDEPMSATNRKKVNIVEMCNPLFARKALGVLPIIDGDDSTKIINGYIHAPALPCEVAIYADEDGQVNVDMLNPEAIFTLFFTDVLFGEQIEDPDFAAAIQELPAVVNGEIKTIIYAALNGAGFDYTPDSEPLGPNYRSLRQVARVVAETPYESPYAHFVYKKRDRSDFSGDEVEAIAASIIDTLSLDGIHHPSLDAKLNIDDWRSARPAPLPVPGNLVIEACSPTNAIAAMGLGMDHATALPCEIAVKALNPDGVDGNEVLMVTYLDPHFMFSALFSDAFDDLSDEELEELLELPPLVLEDLQTIVKAALRKKNLGYKLTRPKQVFFDMLPDDGGDDDDDDDDDHKKRKRK
jgi:uncharacterized protein (DUF302 family)